MHYSLGASGWYLGHYTGHERKWDQIVGAFLCRESVHQILEPYLRHECAETHEGMAAIHKEWHGKSIINNKLRAMYYFAGIAMCAFRFTFPRRNQLFSFKHYCN
jgi:hypothetical protein